MLLVEYLARFEVFLILFAYHIAFTAKIRVIFCKLDDLASVASNRTIKLKVNTGQNDVRFNEITYFLIEKVLQIISKEGRFYLCVQFVLQVHGSIKSFKFRKIRW